MNKKQHTISHYDFNNYYDISNIKNNTTIESINLSNNSNDNSNDNLNDNLNNSSNYCSDNKKIILDQIKKNYNLKSKYIKTVNKILGYRFIILINDTLGFSDSNINQMIHYINFLYDIHLINNNKIQIIFTNSSKHIDIVNQLSINNIKNKLFCGESNIQSNITSIMKKNDYFINEKTYLQILLIKFLISLNYFINIIINIFF